MRTEEEVKQLLKKYERMFYMAEKMTRWNECHKLNEVIKTLKWVLETPRGETEIRKEISKL